MHQNMWSAPILILKVGCPSSSSWFCGSFNSWNVSVLAVAKWPWLHRKGDQEMTSFNRIMESLETKNQWLQMTPKLCNKFGSRHVRPPSPLNKKNSCLCLSVYLFFCWQANSQLFDVCGVVCYITMIFPTHCEFPKVTFPVGLPQRRPHCADATTVSNEQRDK